MMAPAQGGGTPKQGCYKRVRSTPMKQEACNAQQRSSSNREASAQQPKHQIRGTARHTMAKSIFLRPWDLLCVLWFLVHIPMTLLMDSQSILPLDLLALLPHQLKDLLQWHIATNGDHLVRDNPVWFVAFVWCEVAVQLPFFLIAAYAYMAGCNWIRIPAIMYGVHAATTVVPMLADFYYGAGRHNPQKEVLCCIYGTYLVFPLLIALSMALSRIPFPAEKKKKVA